MSYTIQAETMSIEAPSKSVSEEAYNQKVVSQELSDAPSARELFSYGVCCVAQGLMWAASFAGIVFAAGAANQGILSTLP